MPKLLCHQGPPCISEGLCYNRVTVTNMYGRCYCQGVIVVYVITTNCFHILCGRCYCHVADGIATAGWEYLWQMLMPLADGMATGSVYFNFSSEVLNRTSSHMCGRWYLPMFLLRDGLLTLMYIASLIVLMRFCFSLPTILKFSIDTCDQWCCNGQILGRGPWDVPWTSLQM